MKDTFKKVTKTLPFFVKICFILSMILQLVAFLIGGVSFLQFVEFEALVVILYCSYVGVFHISRIFNEEKFLDFMAMLGGNEDE